MNLRFAGTLLALVFLSACGERLVDESYVSLERKSINGIDAFVALLDSEIAAREGEVFHTGFLNQRVRAEADLVVHFERETIDDPEYYRHLEGYLYGYDQADMVDYEFDPFRDGESGVPPTGDEAVEEAIDVDWSPAVPAFKQLEETPDSETDTNAPAPDRYKTILYFMRDTDSSVPFWTQLTESMSKHPGQHAYCARQLASRYLVRSLDAPAHVAPFSTRSTAHPEGALVDGLRWNRAVFPAKEFPTSGTRFPVRTVPGSPFSLFGLDAEYNGITSRSLLATGNGVDVIRELELPRARLILIYNAESFLNYSMVYSDNRKLARRLLQHALNRSGQTGPVAALVRNRLVYTDVAAEADLDLWRALKVFPLNLVIFHFLALLVLFLLSRWPHARPPLENTAAGTREFLEHIRALGVRLSRTTPRLQALEPLLKYKQKATGRDYSAIIEKLSDGEIRQGEDTPDDNNGNKS